jgi:hypothetical protein
MAELECEPCLADAAGAGEGQQPGGGHTGSQLGQLALAPDEAGELGGQVRPPPL